MNLLPLRPFCFPLFYFVTEFQEYMCITQFRKFSFEVPDVFYVTSQRSVELKDRGRKGGKNTLRGKKDKKQTQTEEKRTGASHIQVQQRGNSGTVGALVFP